jgi:hypothetical protein
VRRAEVPTSDWGAGLYVYSLGSGPWDAQAHVAIAQRVLPLAIARDVRALVDRDVRPQVEALTAPASSPEPSGETVLELGGAPPASDAPTAPSAPPARVPPSAAPALRQLLMQLDARWPGRSRALDGVLASKAHHERNPMSDHETGDALDITHDPANGPDLNALAEALLSDDRTSYVIWQRKIANNTPSTTGTYQWAAGEWRPYPTPWMIAHGSKNVDPHESHLHLSIFHAKRDDVRPWEVDTIGGGGLTPTIAPPLPGVALPAARPFAPGEGRTSLDPREPLGTRAVRVSIDEERSGVREGPRTDLYRRSLDPHGRGAPWNVAGFSWAGTAALQPGEQLPHAYTNQAAVLASSPAFRRKGAYAPTTGDGALFRLRGGRVARVSVPPTEEGAFEAIWADADGRWQQREHRVDDPELVGWISYVGATKPAGRGVGKLREQLVVEGLGVLPVEEYVARVVTGEVGDFMTELSDLDGLRAQAIAARTYVQYNCQQDPKLGTAEKPVRNTPQFQVFARVPKALPAQATAATRGGLALYRTELVCTFYVSGGAWPPGANNGRNGSDPTHTEHNVTYNAGLTGSAVVPSPMGTRVQANRGCMSAEGARTLSRRGMLWPSILRYFYGADLDFTIPEPRPTPMPPRPGVSPMPGTPMPGTPLAPSARGARGDDAGVLLLGLSLAARFLE